VLLFLSLFLIQVCCLPWSMYASSPICLYTSSLVSFMLTFGLCVSSIMMCPWFVSSTYHQFQLASMLLKHCEWLQSEANFHCFCPVLLATSRINMEK
jgi:hypothetical protein